MSENWESYACPYSGGGHTQSSMGSWHCWISLHPECVSSKQPRGQSRNGHCPLAQTRSCVWIIADVSVPGSSHSSEVEGTKCLLRLRTALPTETTAAIAAHNLLLH